MLTRSFDASCDSVCDGSIEVLNYSISPDRAYYWRSANERGYRLLEDATLGTLCSGLYLLRQVDTKYEPADQLAFASLEDEDFELVCLISFTSMERKELTLFLDLNKDVDYLNYQTKAEYSIDDGITWKTSSQLNRKVYTDISGHDRSKYLLNLPKSASDRSKVKVRIYARKLDPEKEAKHEQIKIKSSFLESKTMTEVEVEVHAQEAMSIQSTVSNEIDGHDGYISLDIEGGSPPYNVLWENGSSHQSRKNLQSGAYQVNISDSKKCQLNARFMILPPAGFDPKQDFRLSESSISGYMKLEIEGLYRQPLDLIISHSNSSEVKRFKINPLYDDLTMDLDLSYLQKGEYLATLSTSGFSKKTRFSIK